jgi:hypothetical protein
VCSYECLETPNISCEKPEKSLHHGRVEEVSEIIDKQQGGAMVAEFPRERDGCLEPYEPRPTIGVSGIGSFEDRSQTTGEPSLISTRSTSPPTSRGS